MLRKKIVQQVGLFTRLHGDAWSRKRNSFALKLQ